MLDTFKGKLLYDKETRPAAVLVNRSSFLALIHIIEGVNTYIKTLNTEDSVIRVKDLLALED